MDKLAAFYLLLCIACTSVAALRKCWSAVGAGGMLLVTWVLTNTWIHWQEYEVRAEANALMDSVCFVICGFLLMHGWRPWRAALSLLFFIQILSHISSAVGDGGDLREYVCVFVRNTGFFFQCVSLLFAVRIKEFDPRRDPLEPPEVVEERRAA